MSEGCVLECDSPAALLKAGGAFAKLVSEVGPADAVLLRSKANAAAPPHH